MQDLFDLNQQHLVGKLILAPKGNCAIGKLSVPMAKDVLVLSASDLQHQDMKIIGDFFPVLAGNVVKYDNQPVLAVFGPDFESVELYSKQIKIDYLPIETVPEPVCVKKLSRKFGESYDSVEGTEFTTTLTANSHSESTISGQRVHAVYYNGKIHIKCVSQWPVHIKQQVARELGMDESNVFVYPQDCYSPNDQLVYQPTITSILASVAALKTGKLVELSVSMTSTQPKTDFEITTKHDSEGNVVAVKAKASVDQGCYPLFTSEYSLSVMAGLIPVYPVKSCEIDVSMILSGSRPACFFGDMGYGVAVAATEMHMSKLSKTIGKSPASYRESLLGRKSERNLRSQVIESHLFDKLPQTIKTCVSEAVFERFHAVNSQKGINGNTLMPAMARGIGISCGEGTQGFSSQFPYLKDYSISVTLDRNKNVTISKSIQTTEDNLKLWSSIAAKMLDVKAENISFSSINDSGVADNGPAVLARSHFFMTSMLEKACNDIKSRINQGFPITSTVAFTPSNRALYDSYCNGTVIVSLHIDYLTFTPVVDSVVARMAFGKILVTTGLKSHLRNIITKTISEICPDVNRNYSIDLKLAADQSQPVGSGDSIVRGLTGASFMSALCQALNHDVDKMPVTQNDVLAIIKGRNVKQEVKDENQLHN